MRTRTTHDLPAQLDRTRRRFEHWRQTRLGCSRIPAGLWASAVKAAGRHGLHPTAQALGLDYNSLKRHVEAAASLSDRPASGYESEGRAATTFVELAPGACGGAAECMLEMENPSGAKMRIHLKGVPAPDLAALSRSFWSSEA